MMMTTKVKAKAKAKSDEGAGRKRNSEQTGAGLKRRSRGEGSGLNMSLVRMAVQIFFGTRRVSVLLYDQIPTVAHACMRGRIGYCTRSLGRVG